MLDIISYITGRRYIIAPGDKVKFIRDSDPPKRAERPKKGRRHEGQTESLLQSMAAVPMPCQEASVPSSCAPVQVQCGGLSRARKRKRETSAKAESRSDAIFQEHWRAERLAREAVSPLITPLVPAADRLKALRDRVLARGVCNGSDPP